MHKFRFGLGAKWKKVSFDGNNIQYHVGEKLVTEIPVSKVEEIHIARQMGNVFSGKVIGNRTAIKIGTNAPEEVATPYQATDTFGEFFETLREHPENSASYVIGSNVILLFGILLLLFAIACIILGVVMFSSAGVGSLKVLIGGILFTGVSIPMIAGGRAKRVRTLEFLPYEL